MWYEFTKLFENSPLINVAQSKTHKLPKRVRSLSLSECWYRIGPLIRKHRPNFILKLRWIMSSHSHIHMHRILKRDATNLHHTCVRVAEWLREYTIVPVEIWRPGFNAPVCPGIRQVPERETGVRIHPTSNASLKWWPWPPTRMKQRRVWKYSNSKMVIWPDFLLIYWTKKCYGGIWSIIELAMCSIINACSIEIVSCKCVHHLESEK